MRQHPLYVIDANVLVYNHDPREPVKTERAHAVLGELSRRRMALIPVQALAEFSSVCIAKLGFESEVVREQVEDLVAGAPTLPLTANTVMTALRGVASHHLSYYDAQIWAAARLNGIEVILSEDFSDGRVIEGVTIVDPFRMDDPSVLWGGNRSEEEGNA